MNQEPTLRPWLLGVASIIGLLVGCSPAHPPVESSLPVALQKKTGVLLVSHGSQSAQWRSMLMDIENAVHDPVLSSPSVSGIKSAFMEYSEPSIATRLKEFDEEGFTDIIIVPILLTVSSHSFDDIPTICGQKTDRKTLDTLKLEGIVVYRPRARVTLAPLLDFPSVLSDNVIRRTRAMSTHPDQEGLVLVAYGSETYNEEWEQLLNKVGDQVRKKTGVHPVKHSWCGHLVHYKTAPTEAAIQAVLAQKESALVVPVLVAIDDYFQDTIIGGAIENINQGERIRYRHDAILPDPKINQWIVQITHQLASETTGSRTHEYQTTATTRNPFNSSCPCGGCSQEHCTDPGAENCSVADPTSKME